MATIHPIEVEIMDCRKEVTTTGEAAKMWSVSRKAITGAINRGRIPSRLSENIHIIKLVDVMEYFGRYPDVIPKELQSFFDDLER